MHEMRNPQLIIITTIIPPISTSKPVIIHNTIEKINSNQKSVNRTHISLAESAYSSLESPLGRSTTLVIDNQVNCHGGQTLVQRCVVVYADLNGYGISVSRTLPVLVENVGVDGASYKAGVRMKDRIVKVNGIVVTSSNCSKVLNMIYGNTNVVLTLQGKPIENIDISPETSNQGENDRIELRRKEKINGINQMLQVERSNVEKLKDSSSNSKTPLRRTLKRIEVLQTQLKKLENKSFDSQTVDEYETLADTSTYSTPISYISKPNSYYDTKLTMNNGKYMDSSNNSIEPESDVLPSVINLSAHGPFSNLPELKTRPAHLAIFLNYLLNAADPSSLLFCLITDVYQTAPVTYKELRKWAYEIFSTFLIPNAPLLIPNIDQSIIQSIDKILAMPTTCGEEYLEELHRLFIPSKRKALEHVNLDLVAFRYKQQLGLGEFFDPKILEQLTKNGSGMEDRIAEQLLLKALDAQYTIINGDFDKAKSRSIGIVCSLATVIKIYFGMKPNSSHYEKLLEKCPTFVSKDKTSSVFKMKGINSKKGVNIKGHQFNLQSVGTTIYCYQCREAVWGVNAQAYFCQNCDVTIHKSCSTNLSDHCYPASQQKKIQNLKKKVNLSSGISASKSNLSDLATHPQFGNESSGALSTINMNDTTSHGLRFPAISTSSSAPSNNPSNMRFMAGALPPTNTMERTAAYVEAAAAFTAAGISKGPTSSVLADELIYNKSTFSDSDIISTGSNWMTNCDYKEKSVSRSQSLHYNKSFDGKSRVNNGKNDIQQSLARVNEMSNHDINSMAPDNDTSVNPVLAAVSSTAEDGDILMDSGENDSDLIIDTEIPLLETLLSTEVIRHLKPKERKRQEVLNELFHTERTHVRNLKVLYKVFYQPLMTKKWCSSVELEILFGHLEELLELHQEIVKKFQSRIDSWKEQPNYNGLFGDISDLALDIFYGIDGERLKQAAAEFCKNQQHALDYLRRKQAKGRDDPLAKFLIKAESNRLCRKLQLKDMLPMEMQRLVKYPLLLEGVAKYTQDPSSEYEGLLKCITNTKKIVSFVNNSKEATENERKLMEINNRIDSSYKTSTNEMIKNFDITKHKLIYDGSLQWKISKTKLIDMHVVLLHGYLICLTKSADGNKLYLKSHEPSKEVRLVPIMYLNSLMIREKASDKKAFFALYRTNDSQQMFDVVAPTVTELKTWFKFLGEQIEIIQKDALHDPSLRFNELSMDAKSRILTSQNDENTTDSDKVHVITHPRLVGANEIKVQQPTVFEHAEPILTHEERIKRNDRIIMASLAEKHQILCSLVHNISREQLMFVSEQLAGLSVGELKQKDSKELALSAIVHGNRLLDSINKGMTVKKNDNDSQFVIDDPEKNLPSVPCYRLTSIAAPLMNHLKALLQTTQDQQHEILELKKQLNSTIGHFVLKGEVLDENPPAVPNTLPPDEE